jgi:hypothetical protein
MKGGRQLIVLLLRKELDSKDKWKFVLNYNYCSRDEYSG